MTQPDAMKLKRYVYGVHPVNGNNAWKMFVASALGDVAKVRALVDQDRNLVNAQYWYQFPLHCALYGGHSDVVKLLLDLGADPGESIYTYHSWNKLLDAARERGLSRIESLLQSAMRKRFRYSPEFGTLKQAILARDLRQIKAVVKRHPGLIRSADSLGNNPLHWSVLTRQLDLVQRFTELGTPLEARRADGQTPLMLASNGATDYWYRENRGRENPMLRNSAVIVGALLALGAKYSISVAAAVGDQYRVEELLRKDPTLARQLDSARISPLSHSAAQGHLHLVRLFLDHGAEPSRPEAAAPQGLALFEACRGNHVEIAELLLERGADPNAGMDSSGCCLTICEVYHGERARPLQELLRKHGAVTPDYALDESEIRQLLADANPSIPRDEILARILELNRQELFDLYIETTTASAPVMLSSDTSHLRPETAKELLAKGLDPNSPDWLGKTFLHSAAERADRDLAEVFLDAGADINAREVEHQGTPLAAAVRAAIAGDGPEFHAKSYRMIEWLLQRGAAIHLPDDKPWATPLAWARKSGRDDLTKLLT